MYSYYMYRYMHYAKLRCTVHANGAHRRRSLLLPALRGTVPPLPLLALFLHSRSTFLADCEAARWRR